jgi:catechol 2,3-dioxygenase-like lactoylglutathione lyase family enzyme
MSKSRMLAAFLLLAASPFAPRTFAQRGPSPTTFSHIHLTSSNPDAAIAFWKDVIGAQTYTRESMNGVIIPGALILFTKADPAGPSAGSAIDHLGVKVPTLQSVSTRLEKTNFKGVMSKPDGDTMVIDGPDGVRIEVTEDSDMYMSLEFGHIEFRTAKPAEAQAWYAKHFNARPSGDEKVISSRLAGPNVIFAQADSAAPTKGRAIEHIAFESKDLPGLMKALADAGVKLEVSGGGKGGFLTDPSGVRIELLEAVAQ